MLDGKVGEEIVEAIHVPIPFNLLPDLIDRVIESDLPRAKILDSVCVYGKSRERRDADVLQIPCVLVSAGLVVPELGNNELPPVVREEFEQVTDGANPAV